MWWHTLAVCKSIACSMIFFHVCLHVQVSLHRLLRHISSLGINKNWCFFQTSTLRINPFYHHWWNVGTLRIPGMTEMQESQISVKFMDCCLAFEPNSSPRMAIDIIRPRNPLSKSTSIGVALEMLPPKTSNYRAAGTVWYNNHYVVILYLICNMMQQ